MRKWANRKLYQGHPGSLVTSLCFENFWATVTSNANLNDQLLFRVLTGEILSAAVALLGIQCSTMLAQSVPHTTSVRCPVDNNGTQSQHQPENKENMLLTQFGAF